jgi:hypothetical protein
VSSRRSHNKDKLAIDRGAAAPAVIETEARRNVGGACLRVVYAPYLMPGVHYPGPPFNSDITADANLLTTEDLLRVYFWHMAKTDKQRARWQPEYPPSNTYIMSKRERLRTVQNSKRAVQKEIDRRLLEVFEGKDPRAVFKLGRRKRQGQHVDPVRNQAIAMEVLRLSRSHGLSEARAKDHVAAALSAKFGELGMKVIERALKEWRGHPAFSVANIDNYSSYLRALKMIE